MFLKLMSTLLKIHSLSLQGAPWGPLARRKLYISTMFKQLSKVNLTK
eukprot:UN05313